MLEKFFYHLIFAFVCGFTEFLGVDAAPHQLLLTYMSGQEIDPILTVFVRLGVLAALVFACWPRIRHLLRERRMAAISRRFRNRQSDPAALLDMRLLKTAVIPLLISVLFYARVGELFTDLLPLALTLTVNGIILFVPRLLSSGNKDGRSVSRLDAVLIGCGGALAAIPGFSRMGGMLTAGTARGLDRNYALDTALLLSAPTLLFLLVFDFAALFAAKVAFSLAYVLYGAVAFGSAWLAISLIRFFVGKYNFSGFAYYSWGVALFTFVLYLII